MFQILLWSPWKYRCGQRTVRAGRCGMQPKAKHSLRAQAHQSRSLDSTRRFVPAPSSLPVVVPRRRLSPVSFTRYPRTALSATWRSLGITSLRNIGRIRYVHIHSYNTYL
ncbi:hypothetical protein TNCV_2251921 [Trichonephila clavipes]|nr:hypothetical protein TNCV_2251921 [Trichonephila clavipes]